MNTENRHEIQWYACKVFRNKTNTIRRQAEADGFYCYIPMQTILASDGYDTSYVKTYKTRPLVPWLLFIRSDEEYINQLQRNPNSHVGVYCYPGTTTPAPIPDHEMEIFRFVTTKFYHSIESVDEKQVKKGDRVRITGGLLQGAEGYIIRIHGTKRFVVMIEGVAAVATGYIPKQYIEKIIAQ